MKGSSQVIKNDGDLYCQIVYRGNAVMNWWICDAKRARSHIDYLNTGLKHHEKTNNANILDCRGQSVVRG